MLDFAKNRAAAFVMPVFLDNDEQSVQWLREAVGSVLNQTDPNWQLVMVNDKSPHKDATDELERLQSTDKRIHVLHAQENRGAGMSRNAGILWAKENGHPYILYLDCDDVSHPDRVKTVRQVMGDDPSVGVVYSTINIIDENGREVPDDKLSDSILEILECNRSNPPEGELAFIDIGTKTGYANQTSSTAVTTELAAKHLFPDERAVEDAHAWFRYGAEGKKFVYHPDIPTKYRIPQTAADSAMRDRVGGVDAYYKMQCKIERDGFAKALDIAINNGLVKAGERGRLMAGYHVRMAQSMHRIGQADLAKQEIKRARDISPRFTKHWIDLHGYRWLA